MHASPFSPQFTSITVTEGSLGFNTFKLARATSDRERRRVRGSEHFERSDNEISCTRRVALPLSNSRVRSPQSCLVLPHFTCTVSSTSNSKTSPPFFSRIITLYSRQRTLVRLTLILLPSVFPGRVRNFNCDTSGGCSASLHLQR